MVGRIKERASKEMEEHFDISQYEKPSDRLRGEGSLGQQGTRLQTGEGRGRAGASEEGTYFGTVAARGWDTLQRLKRMCWWPVFP